MIPPPKYFEAIRLRAEQRWDQLESDPELAAPWHQLFKQVQCPRHVVSELLQNADDAGATEAAVCVNKKDLFLFQHNGEDFSKEHFASLCGFGYSNKRSLHTIGFRGIGFKSTFSLGDEVHLFSPTLAVSFHRNRFTQPHWLDWQPDVGESTMVLVAVADRHRRKELEKNLEEWLESPLSLLFFRNIRRMIINDQEIQWQTIGPGPVPGSERMRLGEDGEEDCLLVHSDPEPFPEEALDEIRQERILGIEEKMEFPPCRVELVLGGEGRLYVVLPTGVETQLPFACNAPFIQDPARLKIKDPETSPTNRWLLQRAGELAANTMLHWLGNTGLPLEDRARAYGLLPNVDREENSLEGLCAAHAEYAVAELVEGKHLLLCEDGGLLPENGSVILPPEMLTIWPAEQASAALDEENRPVLCHHVAPDDQQKLLDWDLVSKFGQDELVAALLKKHLPKPRTWRQLLALWHYIADEVLYFHYGRDPEELRIIPVQGQDVLYAASEVARLGEKRLLKSDEDWRFLSEYLTVLNQNWLRFLADSRRALNAESPTPERDAIGTAYALLDKLDIEKPSDVSAVIDRVATAFFAQDSVSRADCVRLAQIAAKLGAHAGKSFEMVTADNYRRKGLNDLCFDEDGALKDLFPEAERATRLLHPDYSANFRSCTKNEWAEWVNSGRAAVRTFVAPSLRVIHGYGKKWVENGARKRGLKKELFFPYITEKFYFEDWDFEEVFWTHWRKLERSDPFVWVKVVERILVRGEALWKGARSASVRQTSTKGSSAAMTSEPLRPEWISKLQELPCLLDTWGSPRLPTELLRRTRDTEALLGVEPFVDKRFDTESTWPLLDLLGVRSQPTGPDGILERLRALSKSTNPPIREVEKWYERLDQLFPACSTEEAQAIRNAFLREALILAQDNAWVTSGTVFINADENDVPGAAVLRVEVNEMALWRRIGVAERPTADLAIQWLAGVAQGQVSALDLPRFNALLARHPLRIWDECKHWLNLAGEWTPTEELRFSLTNSTDVPWSHFDPWVKRATADFRRLRSDVSRTQPFSTLPALVSLIEERFRQEPNYRTGPPVRKTWVLEVSNSLRRARLESEEETTRVRLLAVRLGKTRWLESSGLETVPYIKGRPAGRPRRVDVAWIGDEILVDNLPVAKLARRVPEEIGKIFGRQDIHAALSYGFERSQNDVRRYFEANFSLESSEQIGDFGEQSEKPANWKSTEQEPSASSSSSGDASLAEAEEEVSRSSVVDGSGIEQLDDMNGTERRHRTVAKSGVPSIMERFARSRGFRPDGVDRFFHKDGSWIARVNGTVFPWERREKTGELVASYWPKDLCLHQESLQIEAEVWTLMEQAPQSHSLILADTDGNALEFTGAHVQRMLDEGKITLFTASYRIVYDEDTQAH